jgi:tRNA pseudouridine55 synthase
MAPCGIFNLNKPAGMTSRQVVNRIQRLVRPAKVGHAGTLDPLATGVLVVCVGAATRLIEYVQQMPKGYTGTFLLGRQSPTEDIEGEITELVEPPVPTRQQIGAAAEALVGRIEQRPPAYSALKVAGRRAYKLARRGEPVELKPRPVTVHQITIQSYEYPELVLNIGCGSGTYIRSLGRDLAKSLGTAAVLSALVRTSIGSFRIDEAVDHIQVTKANWTDHLQPALRAVEAMPRIELSHDEVTQIGHGHEISKRSVASDADQFAAVNAAGQLVAILTRRAPGRLRPLRNLPQE